METATREYLKQRFGDYYTNETIPEPDPVVEREFGFIPWSDDTRMIRHLSYLQMDGWDDYLSSKRPQHLYMSAAKFDNPAASTMGEKGRNGTTLVFDIDADHLPGVDPDETGYEEMLAHGKENLLDLLDLLESDLGFTDLRVLFSGGRGYHVHVYDDGTDDLGKTARQEIVDYLVAEDISIENITVKSSTFAGNDGVGRKSSTDDRELMDGGWGARVHKELLEEVERLTDMDEGAALAELTELDDVGEGRAEALVNLLDPNNKRIREGAVTIHSAYTKLVEKVMNEVAVEQAAHVDEPVTTDLNRLIRLPESLHGGTALKVTDIPVSEVSEFDPMLDAVPDEFTGDEVTVDLIEDVETSIGGTERAFEQGDRVTVPEYVGLFLMAREHADYVSG